MIAIIALVALLVLSSCRSGSDFQTNKLPDGSGSTPAASTDSKSDTVEPAKPADTEQTPAETASTDVSNTTEEKKELPPVNPDLDKVTEVKSYDTKASCTIDKLGVVRTFDDAGKKTVFRPFCDGDNLFTYKCVEGNKASASSKSCGNGCYVNPENGLAECRKVALPPHQYRPPSN